VSSILLCYFAESGLKASLKSLFPAVDIYLFFPHKVH
jgi:hypothetical protein